MCNVEVVPGATEWSGQLKIWNIQYDNGAPVAIKKYLGVKLTAPGSVTSKGFNVQTDPWMDITPVVTSDFLDDSTFDVTARLVFASPQQLNHAATITIAVDGNLGVDSQRWTESVQLTAD